MAENYVVPKDLAQVTLHPPGIETRLFLSRSARGHGGHEQISDLLSSDDPFLPTHPGESIVLFRKSSLSWIQIHDPLETEQSFLDASSYARRLAVELSFEDGSALEGSFVVVARDGASRVSDVANSADRTWVHFEDDENHYLVNLGRVRSITPAGGN